MRHHIYVFLVIATFLCLPLYSSDLDSLARAEVSESLPDSAVAGLSEAKNSVIGEFFGITASVTYPSFPDGSHHSALRRGDSFTIYASSYDILLRDAYVDVHELGLPAQIPLSGSFGKFTSDTLLIPEALADGAYQLTVHATSPLGNDITASIEVIIDSTEPTGTLEASFGTTTDDPTQYVAHLAGNVDGTGSVAIITGGRVFSADASDMILSSIELDTKRLATLPSPFSTSFAIPTLDPSWTRIGISLDLVDEAGNARTIKSAPFPRASSNGVLIHHAQAGSRVEAPNYVPGDIPAGVGISHTLLNSLPQGNYYAVVFFEGLPGCPTNNYQINAFRAGAYWGYGVVGPNGLQSQAWSSRGGGCMQQFQILPTRGDDWLWGALSTTGTATAIADTNGIPAFAICATKEACDFITPSSAIEPPETHAVSNVLFLPGIKGSLLYEENPLCLIPNDNCDIRLWLPLADAAVPLLYLDHEGKSTRDVYAREGNLLANAFGASFYDSFSTAMDARRAAASEDAPWRWQAAAYDWRLSLPDITERGRNVGSRVYFDSATSTPYLEASLRSLAADSATGKVTIVAHSNGGLVAKALLERLGDQEAAQLVDAVIFVAVPQGGAPRAIASLLYGESEAIPRTGRLAGLLLSAARARTFAHNAPMAYHLLPSAAFLAAHLNPGFPLLAFGSGQLLEPLRARFGTTIDSWKDFVEFALGTVDARSEPEERDLAHASVLNSTLLAYAEREHTLQYAWKPPAGVAVHEIGGTGIATLSGILLYEQPTRESGVASTTLSYRPLFQSGGDGTVPLTSAHLMNVGESISSYTIDLPAASDDEHWYSHGNILETPEVGRLIGRIIDGDVGSETASPFREAEMLGFKATGENPVRDVAFYLHGDAQLTLTDAEGRQTISGNETSVQEIPGSQGGSMGNVFYVLAPLPRTYTLTVSQSRDSYVTLDIEVREDDVVISSSTVASIALRRNGAARLEFGVESEQDMRSQLTIDHDGDGAAEASVALKEGETIFPPESLAAASRLQEDDSQGAESAQEETKRMVAKGTSPTSTRKTIAVSGSSTTQVMPFTNEKLVAQRGKASAVQGTSTKEVIENAAQPTRTQSWWERLIRILRQLWALVELWFSKL